MRLMVAPRTYTNLVAAVTERSTQDRAAVDLTGRSNVRLLAHVSTVFVTGNVKVQYSTDGTNWSDLTTGLVSPTGAGPKASASAAIPAGAKALVLLRIVGYGGNTTEDPVVNAAVVEVT